MANLKSLFRDTALYGMSSIVGRFLNYLLVPLYTAKLAASSGGYGVITNVYAYTALLLVLLTFGMETTFFRFVNKEGADVRRTYSTVLIMVGTVCVVFVAAVVVTLAYADRLIDLLTAMGQGFYTFVSIAPQEKLMQYFRVSLLAAVVVTVPVALYQVYAFAKPGLKKSETFFLKLVILLGLALFVVGVMFAYKLMMPFMLRFLSTGIEGADYIQTTTSIESYVSLCLTMFIIFGCVFEMPLVTIILSKMGIANPQILKKGRGVAIVLIFFIAAVVTPPDIVSQCMVAIPMVLLYFVSIFLSGIFYKPRSESEDEEDAEEEDED